MKIKELIGLMLFILGWITLDNEYFIIPAAIAGIGGWLLKDLMERGAEDEWER